MRQPSHPTTEALDLASVLHALSDPLRLQIVAAAAASEAAHEPECGCATIELGVSPATKSHHFRVLREAGVTRTRIDGRNWFISLRRDDLEARFPGLLPGVLQSIAAN